MQFENLKKDCGDYSREPFCERDRSLSHRVASWPNHDNSRSTQKTFLHKLVVSSAVGPFDGQLFVSSGRKGQLRAISPSGIDTTLNAGPKLSYVEGIYIIPRDFGTSGRSESEGFYTYIWLSGLLKTDPHDLVSLRGDALVSTINGVELLWRMHWNGSSFEFSTVAEYPDNILAHELVTFDKISSGGKCSMNEDRVSAKHVNSNALPRRLNHTRILSGNSQAWHEADQN